MGKIVRFDTARAIKEAAARAEARQRHPTRRQFRPLKQRSEVSWRWSPSGTTIFNLAMVTFLAVWFAPDYLSPAVSPGFLFAPATTFTDAESARFSFCHSGGGTNCVVDGDTVWYRGNNIRIADIDTPETHPPGCAEEARLGKAATDRLHELLNAGAFSIKSIDHDTDPYGRQLRILTRGGKSIGGMLVGDGLARWYGGGRQPWC
jgi:micrococcal nuclease